MKPLIMRLATGFAAGLLMLSGCLRPDSDAPHTPNDFGYAYNLGESDSLPRLQGDSLYVEVGYGGCGPGHAFTLESSKTGASSFEVWLFKENEEDCRAVFVEVRAFKVPDEIRDAQSVTLIKPVNGRIELVPSSDEDSTPQPPVYDFGDHYTVLESDNLPRLQGDSLYVTLGYVCGAAFTLRHVETGESSHEIWLHNAGTMAACAVPVIDSARAFEVPDEIRDAQSVTLIKPDSGRIELVPSSDEDSIPQPPVYDFGYFYTLVQSDSMPRLEGDSLYVDLGYDGCNVGAAFTLEHFKVNQSSYEIWLNKEGGTACALPLMDRGRAFKIPDEIKSAASVRLVTRDLERIELKD